MPRVYIFDAVHTFLRPVPDVLSAYLDAGRLHGSELSKEELGSRFRVARRKLFSTYVAASQTQPGSLTSSDAIEHQLWRDLIAEIFTEIKPIDTLFSQLWKHFASPENWQLYDDVTACWSRLHANGDRIIVASNFDSRLHAIVEYFPQLSVAEAVYCSAEVGYRKPDPLFYQTVAKSLGLKDSDDVIMIGDDSENDFIAPRRFGWKALHLDRRTFRRGTCNTIPDLNAI